MDVFSLDDHLLAQYTGFARSFTRIRATEIQNKVDKLYAGRRFWPEPLIQLNPHFEGGGSIRALVDSKGLVADCAQIFRDPRPTHTDPDKSLKLRRHQEQAISLALDGKSFVVTTGTGSGKSLCCVRRISNVVRINQQSLAYGDTMFLAYLILRSLTYLIYVFLIIVRTMISTYLHIRLFGLTLIASHSGGLRVFDLCLHIVLLFSGRSWNPSPDLYHRVEQMLSRAPRIIQIGHRGGAGREAIPS